MTSVSSKEAFLGEPSHRIVFDFTPKHCFRLNQIEIWLSVLARKVARHGNFTSKADSKTKVRAFIAYFNETMAKPFRWAYQAKLLIA